MNLIDTLKLKATQWEKIGDNPFAYRCSVENTTISHIVWNESDRCWAVILMWPSFRHINMLLLTDTNISLEDLKEKAEVAMITNIRDKLRPFLSVVEEA